MFLNSSKKGIWNYLILPRNVKDGHQSEYSSKLQEKGPSPNHISRAKRCLLVVCRARSRLKWNNSHGMMGTVSSNRTVLLWSKPTQCKQFVPFVPSFSIQIRKIEEDRPKGTNYLHRVVFDDNNIVPVNATVRRARSRLKWKNSSCLTGIVVVGTIVA